MKHYSGDYAQQVIFPLSGIGCGGLGISGIGALVDWELDGRANKGSVNEYSHFAIKAERNGKTVDARVLQGDLTYALSGTAGVSHHHSWGYGQGPNRTTLAGLSHCENVDFCGRFPFAEIEYSDNRMPAKVTLEAFNPFIPLDEDNSSIPAAFFKWKITNTGNEKTDYTLAFSCGNPFKITDGGTNRGFHKNGITGVVLSNDNIKRDTNGFGELCLSTDCKNANVQEYWYRSGWFDDLTVFWKEFSDFGKLNNRTYNDNDGRGKLDIGDMCTLEAQVSLLPGETAEINFTLCWYFPVFVKYWDDSKPEWKHEYCRRFSSVEQVLDYCTVNREMLYSKSRSFSDAICSSTLPQACLETAADCLCVLKSPTCLRLENGEFWAFEGTGADKGSCEGTCDHVWMYQYALPFLFPRLARQIIETDLTYNMRESGELMFRTMLPLGSDKWDFRACVDGQMGLVIRFYREWKLSGDDLWLRKWWPKVKKVLGYAWSKDNSDLWDPDKSGVLSGRQHHTLDVELFGMNSWLQGYYLGALKAASEITEYLGEKDKSEEYKRLFNNGRKITEKELFNGRHYIQKIDVKDKSVLERFISYDSNILDSYWNYEKKEIKYQYASGCEIDQLVAQWHANIIGLGDLFDREHRKTAISNMYKINYLSMRDVFNPCRIFALNDEKGMLICQWENKEEKPVIPLPYTEECMTGFEYGAAGLMISEGFTEEGISVINSIRERYDGKKRNPFAEIECGSSYARSMAAFSLFATFSGFRFDIPKGLIGFAFPYSADFNGKSEFFWSVGTACGTVTVSDDQKTVKLIITEGTLYLNGFILPEDFKAESVIIDEKPVEFFQKNNTVFFKNCSVKKLTLTQK